VRVDQILQRQERVKTLFDLIHSVALDVAADARGVVRHLVDHFAIGAAEPDVVLEEIAVRIHMRDHRLVIDRHIVAQEIRITRVAVNDHFINPA